MKLHVVGLPWTETTPGYETCAYTGKLFRFGEMMLPLGYEVIHYGGENNTATCTEHVPLVSREERVRWFGEHNANGLWGNITWDPASEPWMTMNARAIEAIRERAEKRDLILLVAGQSQQPIAQALPALTTCEPFVGYSGIFADFCAFESHFWRAHIYGKRSVHDPRFDDGRWYDATIPNFFDERDFHYGDDPDDYLLFVGRVTVRKNPHVAAMIARELGMRLVVAGPGVIEAQPGLIVADHCSLHGDVEWVGPVGPIERASYMANAKALIAPTAFLEPFGGVAVEAMLCGTPVVSTDWGAFTETVVPGVSGYRFTTLAEGVAATRQAFDLDRTLVRSHAFSRYELAKVGPQFDRWFRQLDGLWEGGWGVLDTGVSGGMAAVGLTIHDHE